MAGSPGSRQSPLMVFYLYVCIMNGTQDTALRDGYITHPHPVNPCGSETSAFAKLRLRLKPQHREGGGRTSGSRLFTQRVPRICLPSCNCLRAFAASNVMLRLGARRSQRHALRAIPHRIAAETRASLTPLIMGSTNTSLGLPFHTFKLISSDSTVRLLASPTSIEKPPPRATTLRATSAGPTKRKHAIMKAHLCRAWDSAGTQDRWCIACTCYDGLCGYRCCHGNVLYTYVGVRRPPPCPVLIEDDAPIPMRDICIQSRGRAMQVP